MMQFSIIPLPKGSGNFVVAFSLLSLLYICIVPFCWVDNTTKFTTHEGKYIEATKITICTRFIIMILGASLSVENIYWTLAFDALTIGIYYSVFLYRKYMYYSANRVATAMFPHKVKLKHKK